MAGEKSPDAFRTIGELSAELGVAQHILRYWETKFPQLKPLQRAGNRRYYRPDDVALAKRINRLLNEEGYTVKGVQKLLREKAADEPSIATPTPTSNYAETPMEAAESVGTETIAVFPAEEPAIDVFRLIAIRDKLAAALND
nr:MerR family transcriptional regulator [uncultured Sphingomonas sp.]